MAERREEGSLVPFQLNRARHHMVKVVCVRCGEGIKRGQHYVDWYPDDEWTVLHVVCPNEDLGVPLRNGLVKKEEIEREGN